jgi:hypothetical protein
MTSKLGEYPNENDSGSKLAVVRQHSKSTAGWANVRFWAVGMGPGEVMAGEAGERLWLETERAAPAPFVEVTSPRAVCGVVSARTG